MPRKQNVQYDHDAFVRELVACRDALDPPTWTELSYTVRLPSATISRIQSGVVAQPSRETVEKLANKFPHRAFALYRSSGYPLPAFMLEWQEVAEIMAGYAGMEAGDYQAKIRRLLRGLLGED